MIPMRRAASQIPDDQAMEILRDGVWGTLATVDADGQPYAVPLNYVFVDRIVYIHSADVGHKVTNLRQNPSVSFAVVASARVRPGHFDMRYRSAVLFGTARLVADPNEKQHALEALMDKYASEFHDRAMAYISRTTDRTAVFAIEITHLTGKAR